MHSVGYIERDVIPVAALRGGLREFASRETSTRGRGRARFPHAACFITIFSVARINVWNVARVFA